MSGNRGKYIPPVKGWRDAGRKIPVFSKMNYHGLLKIRYNRAEIAFIRPDKNMTGSLKRDKPSITADTRINNRHMDRPFREEGECLPYHAGGLYYGTGHDMVADVYNTGLIVDGKYHTLHHRQIGVHKPEIGSKGYNA